MPETDRPELSVVLPAYEEAENLRVLLPRLRQAAGALTPAHEIIVVDAEAPRDETPAVCRENGVRYVPRRGGSPYGNAVRTGLAESQGAYVILMDADGSHAPEFLAQLWPFRES